VLNITQAVSAFMLSKRLKSSLKHSWLIMM